MPPSSEAFDETYPAVRRPSSEQFEETLPAVQPPSSEELEETLPAVQLPSSEELEETLPAVEPPSGQLEQTLYGAEAPSFSGRDSVSDSGRSTTEVMAAPPGMDEGESPLDSGDYVPASGVTPARFATGAVLVLALGAGAYGLLGDSDPPITGAPELAAHPAEVADASRDPEPSSPDARRPTTTADAVADAETADASPTQPTTEGPKPKRGKPASVRVWIKPCKVAYGRRDRPRAHAKVLDGYETELRRHPKWTVHPRSLGKVTRKGQLRFKRAGRGTVRGCVARGTICHEVSLVVLR